MWKREIDKGKKFRLSEVEKSDNKSIIIILILVVEEIVNVGRVGRIEVRSQLLHVLAAEGRCWESHLSASLHRKLWKIINAISYV